VVKVRSATFPRGAWWTFEVLTAGSPLRITLGSPTLEVCPVSGDEYDERIGFPRRIGFESCLRPNGGLVTVPLTGATLGRNGAFAYRFAVRSTGRKQDADLAIAYSRPVEGFSAVSPRGARTHIVFTPTSATLAVLSFKPPDTDNKVDTAVHQGRRSLSGEGPCKESTGFARCVRGVVPGRAITVEADADSDERVSTQLAWPADHA
jgi:hypothetical protein